MSLFLSNKQIELSNVVAFVADVVVVADAVVVFVFVVVADVKLEIPLQPFVTDSKANLD